MIKRLFLCLTLLLLPVGAMAQSVQDQIVAQLQEQGFTQIEVSQTWLGRTRIIAFSETLRRELVLNPATGEILRDYWAGRDSALATARIPNPKKSSSNGSGSSGGNASNGGGDDHDDDREDDDHEDDDSEDDDHDD